MKSLVLALVLATFAGGSLACRTTADGTRVPASATSTVISLTGIDCEDCSLRVTKKLKEKPGFYDATFDRVKAELTVLHDATLLDVPAILAVVTSLGYGGIEGPGHGEYLPEVAFADGSDVVKISENGEAVDLASHIVAGKVTVIDFYAVWCEPCRMVDEHMTKVLAAHDDIALRKVNIVDWDSEAAKQHMAGVPSLPYLIVYGRDGKQLGAISGLDLDKLDAAIAQARETSP